MTDKIKVIKKSVTGKDEKGRSLMIIEDESMGNNPRRFATAIAPYDFNAKAGGYISKTKEVNYVKPHMEGINEAKEMYEKLKKESR